MYQLCIKFFVNYYYFSLLLIFKQNTMKKIKKNFDKMKTFIKGDNTSKIHPDEKPLYEFSKKFLEK